MGMRDEEAEINMSEITVDYQGGTLSSDPLEDSYRAEWTNEKHWLYLKSMEASFVNQLHSSIAQVHSKFDSRAATAASQWTRRYRHRGKNQVVEARISRDIEVNHEQEFESMFKPFLGLVRNSQQSKTTQSVLCRKNGLVNNTEMMGQNFVGNNQVLESNTRKTKRKKIETTSNEDNDQVVPISRPKDMSTR